MSIESSYRTSTLAHWCDLVAEALRPPVGEAVPTALAGAPEPYPLSLLDRLDRWSWRQRQKDRDAVLARATDIADVERRLRDMERDFRYY